MLKPALRCGIGQHPASHGGFLATKKRNTRIGTPGSPKIVCLQQHESPTHFQGLARICCEWWTTTRENA